MDFTLRSYRLLLESLISRGYVFQTFLEFLNSPKKKCVILRHDVDRLPYNSLETAKLEASLGVKGSYYFRILPCSFSEKIIERIASFGHEVGYHYENMDTVSKKIPSGSSFSRDQHIDKAFEDFKKNLDEFRKIASIKTICMHGSPKSKFDNREIWSKHNYYNLGITGEPYFDVDYNKVFYLTDTGRRWDGHRFSVRDKVSSTFGLSFRTTHEIVRRIHELPEQIMITVHPQRWTNKPLPWLKEFFLQNLKNQVKRFLVK